MADQYRNFASLAANETRGVHYEIDTNDLDTSVVVIAPHGGFIERGTSEIVRAIAGNDFSSYCFEGLIQGRPHRDLHIASHLFDEPESLRMVRAAETAVAIHGRKNRQDRKTIEVGGRNFELRSAIGACLEEAGYQVGLAAKERAAADRSNICNRGTAGAGVQLELPLELRVRLVADAAELQSFSKAVRKAMLAFIEKHDEK